MILTAPLHPEVVAMLDAQRRAGAKPRAEMSVAETREAMRAARQWQAAPHGDTPFRDLDANGVPIRYYGTGNGRALLYFHGGRFFSGDLESHHQPLCALASLSGCAIVAVDYRLAPEHPFPAAVEDAHAAARWLAERSNRFAVCGDSAGGFLAAHANVGACWQALIYPMLQPAGGSASYREFAAGPWPNGEDMRRGWELFGPGPQAPPASAQPPAFVATAGWDPLRDEALDYVDALRAAGCAVEHHHFPDMAHGFFTQTSLSRSEELIGLLARALRDRLA